MSSEAKLKKLVKKQAEAEAEAAAAASTGTAAASTGTSSASGGSASSASAASAAAEKLGQISIGDPLSINYGDVPLIELQSKPVTGRKWTEVRSLGSNIAGKEILLRGRVVKIRSVSKKMAFLVVRESGYTVQCVVAVAEGKVSRSMVDYVTHLTPESIVDVQGLVVVPAVSIQWTSQQVEIQVTKVHCISRAASQLPFNFEDASRSEAEIEEALKEGKQLVRVKQETRLDFRVLDLRTAFNDAIMHVSGEIEFIFSSFLRAEGFKEIHTPKLLPRAEGGASTFILDYKGQPACLAQSPVLHKQMAICGDFRRVFEMCPAFRAEDSFTHRHLCEFINLVAEMEIKEHYSEIIDIVDRLFVAIFDHLNGNCQMQLEAISRRFSFQPLKYLRKTLQLTFQQGVEMLKEAGIEVDPHGDLNTEAEKKLGELVRNKYDTDFYILHRYPLAARPFFTMPCYDDPAYGNAFDVFIRGEEIISGAQRIHDFDLLTQRAKDSPGDANAIAYYIDCFKYGVPPHGGFGVGLERVVMLFCNLSNIRLASLFPRDPKRLAP